MREELPKQVPLGRLPPVHVVQQGDSVERQVDLLSNPTIAPPAAYYEGFGWQ